MTNPLDLPSAFQYQPRPDLTRAALVTALSNLVAGMKDVDLDLSMELETAFLLVDVMDALGLDEIEQRAILGDPVYDRVLMICNMGISVTHAGYDWAAENKPDDPQF